jgi:diamine N-acetyltransferase
MTVTLREIGRGTVWDICKLDAGDGGRQVAPNAVSIAQAYFAPEAWFRAIHDDDTLVGFVMLYDPTLSTAPEDSRFYLWRLMIDRAHQGRGHGRAAIERLVEHVRSRPAAAALHVSHVQGAAPLARFYQSIGFRYTGEVDDGELVMVRAL